MAQEKNFENRIKKFLKENEMWHVKFFANMYTKAGVPDILAVIRDGKFCGIEVKSQVGKPSPLQMKNIKDIQASGGWAVCVRPKQQEQLFSFLLDPTYLKQQALNEWWETE